MKIIKMYIITSDCKAVTGVEGGLPELLLLDLAVLREQSLGPFAPGCSQQPRLCVHTQLLGHV